MKNYIVREREDLSSHLVPQPKIRIQPKFCDSDNI